MNKFLTLYGSLALVFSAASLAQDEPESHFFTSSDGIKIHYLTQGESGSYVVLVHGFTSSAQNNWFNQGIPQRLSDNHRIVAIDARNHGESDTVEERAPGITRDVLELLDHLQIDKAHLHGYSMGGFATLQILAYAPERLITASFGGSGVFEIDEDSPESQPDYDIDWAEALSVRVPVVTPIDLTKVDIPIMAINGSEDDPASKTTRMTRELKDFTNFVLPGYGHMNAVRPETGYAQRLEFFIDENDQ